MSSFTLNVHTDSAAFYDEIDGDFNPHVELARILRDCADRILSGEDYGHFQTIHDVNGNDVGRFALKDDQGAPLTVRTDEPIGRRSLKGPALGLVDIVLEPVDADEIADALEHFAGIDEGENTDTTNLLRLAGLVRGKGKGS